MTVHDHLHSLASEAAELLDTGVPGTYPTSLAAVIRVSHDHLAREDLAAAQLMEICAFLAPDPIPLTYFRCVPPDRLPGALARTAQRPLALRRAVGRAGRYGLIRVDEHPSVHRLVQAVLRDQLSSQLRIETQSTVAAILIAARPVDMEDPKYWADWGRLLPHLVAADPANSDNHELRKLALDAGWHLINRGNIQLGHAIAETLHTAWRSRLGADHPSTLRAAVQLAVAQHKLGRLDDARRLNEDTLERNRRVFGDDHEKVWIVTANLAYCMRDLGRASEFRTRHEQAVHGLRRLLGEDNGHSLNAVTSFATTLRTLGEFLLARDMELEALTRLRRVMGANHPRTLRSASGLALDLHCLGAFEEARVLNEDTLGRRRELFGDNHPQTLESAQQLIDDLHALGQNGAAQHWEDLVAETKRRLSVG